MTWYNPKDWFGSKVEKLNPAQEIISHEAGYNIGSDATSNYALSFKNLEAVNRAISMIVNGCASLDYDVKEKTHDG